MIQAAVITKLLEEENLPNFVNLVAKPFPEIGQMTHHVASSAASAAARALGGFKSYVGDLRNGLQDMDIQPRFKILRHFIDGNISPDFGVRPIPNIVPVADQNGGSAAASSAAAASAAPGALNDAVAPRLYRNVPKMGMIGNDNALSDATQGPIVAIEN